MNSVEKYFDIQGEVVKSFVDVFLTNDINDVLDYSFPGGDIENYVTNKKISIRDKILLLIKNKKKFIFKETAEAFEITNEFLFYDLNFDGDLAKFKRYLKKADLKQLLAYEKVLFSSDLILEI